MNSPPQTLTHHISYNRKKPQDPASKKAEGPNGYRKNGGGNKGKNRQKFDRFRQEPNGKHHANRNRQEPASNRPRPETTANGKGGSGSSGDKLVANLDRFQLFTAYHLGIGPQKEYKPSNINEVAKRFNIDQATIKQALQEYGMDSASLLERDFDMALAQLDIQVAPEGIDRLELAKSLYEEFLEAPRIKRDWKKMLEDDRKENTKIFGRQ